MRRTTMSTPEDRRGYVNAQGNLPPTQAEDTNLQGDSNPDPKNGSDGSSPAQPLPLCSVLNTIVDHIMVPPTPMEPEEYQEVLAGQQQQQEKEQERDLYSSPQLPTETKATTPTTNGLLVPVMRIFGPVLRRDHHHDDGDSTKRPTQSACLYIHGAFPYMLARPATAGPDGSLHRSSHLMNDGSSSSKLTPSGHIDWDDVESVERILPILQENLQAAIQSSMQDSNFGNNNKNKNAAGNNSAATAAPKKAPVRVIRRLSVVVGRGFYTYCPGPPAPFLRVEYYDPKLRWKVKMMLERGLDLPSLYHPDPIQYDAVGRESAVDDINVDDAGASEETLKFHCYEAHIPYTMQFFKDWNLAGMSHVHCRAGGVQFRNPLPRNPRHQWTGRSVTADPNDATATAAMRAVFLESNTPAEHVWKVTDAKMSNPQTPMADDNESNDNGYMSSDSPAPFLASMQQPSPLEQQQQYSQLSTASTDDNDNKVAAEEESEAYVSEWVVQSPVAPPASPVPPMDTGGRIASAPPGPWTKKETSCDVELDIMVQDILNVNDVITELPEDCDERQKLHWRAVPSLREIWRQERSRMAKLLKPQDDFLSGTPSSSSDVQDEKKKVAPPPFTLSVKDGATLPGTRLAREGMHRLVNVTDGLQENFNRVMRDIVDRHSIAVSQVDRALGKRGPTDGTPALKRDTGEKLDLGPSPLTPSFDETMEALGTLGSGFEDNETITTPFRQGDDGQSQQSSSEQPRSQLSFGGILSQDSAISLRRESRRLSHEEHFQCLSQSYYDTSDKRMNENSQADAFELSQRVERGDCIVDGPFEYIEDFIDPETLVPFDTIDDDGEMSEEEEEDINETRMEMVLSTLATQTLMTGIEESEGDTDAPHVDIMTGIEESQGDTDAPRVGSDADASNHSVSSDDSELRLVTHRNPLDEDFTSNNDRQHVGLGHSEAPTIPNSTPLTKIAPELSRTSYAWPHASEVLAERRARPPTKEETLGSPTATSLYPMQLKGDVPSWMLHSNEYAAIRRTCFSTGRSAKDWFPHIPHGGLSVRPVRQPPKRGTVSSWHRKALKRSLLTATHKDDGGKRRRLGQGVALAKEPVAALAALQIDGNSRKLIGAGSGTMADATRIIAGGQEVEEVEWQLDQQPMPSLTQQPVEGTPVRAADNREGKLEIQEESSKRSGSETKGVSNFSVATSFSKSTPESSMPGETPSPEALQGIGNQGGRIWVEGGGRLKSTTRLSQGRVQKEEKASRQSAKQQNESHSLPSPVSMMAIEVHTQCRTGRAGVNDSKEVSMTPDSERDKVIAVVYIFAKDPGGGEALEILERGCLFVPLDRELSRAQEDKAQAAILFNDLSNALRTSMPRTTMGIASPFSAECVRDERQLLLRMSSIVRWKDPDMLLSWDTQGAGLGYLIERGAALGKPGHNGGADRNPDSHANAPEIDMARLLGRVPTIGTRKEANSTMDQPFKRDEAVEEMDAERTSSSRGKENPKESDRWKGSGLGSEWDDRVGAGAAAASIVGRVVFAGGKIIAEEVKHPNASYLPAVVSSVLNKRIPFHDNLKLTQWYAHDSGRERWRVINHKLTEATACLMLFDALDIVGRAGEAARLSGVEFSQSFPGIRGSQYKVEGVLLRALQSLNSSERGSKKGVRKKKENPSGDAKLSLSGESISQTQSPWKNRRRPVSNENTEFAESRPLHQLSDRCYFFYSPSLQDSNKQEALEAQALTLEPQSGHEENPVVVCDFTALYPSLVIAYNLCYSTVAGRLDYHSTRSEMFQKGRTTGKLGPFLYSESRTATVLKHHVKSLNESAARQDRAYVAPTGTIYVSESVVKGVLPQVLDEMLSTRAMLKKAAKQYKELVPDLAPSILRQLEARQLALKYVANVTYGYTSATFSGRCAMPLLADTIVECGRRTLTSAIGLANSWGSDQCGRWRGCEVIYGDTDSLFVRLPGRSVQEAFQFGEEFCKAVTESNPPPVQLKLEKVYLGSIMQTKKKYCGMKFESKDQRKPAFEAKGLETVRRDQCALTQKILRNSLITLFRNGIGAVKTYLYRQWSLILAGGLPVSDFILTGRVRSRYRGGRVGPVQAVLARRLAEADPGKVVRNKERLAYVIVATPGVTFRLRDCVLTPMELLEQWDAYTIHSAYYITKHVNAALQRCFGLAPHKVDINAWYESCPKPRRRIHFWPTTRSGSSLMISSYFGSDICSLCGRKCMSQGRSRAAVCADCRKDDVKALVTAMQRLNTTQRKALSLANRCSSCNLCFEDAGTFAALQTHQKPNSKTNLFGGSSHSERIVTPLANCSCVDCPTTFDRHKQREAELEAIALCQTLDAI